jgi:hypothetical protein
MLPGNTFKLHRSFSEKQNHLIPFHHIQYVLIIIPYTEKKTNFLFLSIKYRIYVHGYVLSHCLVKRLKFCPVGQSAETGDKTKIVYLSVN